MLKKTHVEFFAVLVIAIILIQTLFFKFTAAPESVYIFETVGLGKFGRISSGIFELIAALLILYKPTRIIGAFMSLGVISGAIFFHLTVLGIEVLDDNGVLFLMAVIVFLLSLIVLLFNKEKIKHKIHEIRKN